MGGKVYVFGRVGGRERALVRLLLLGGVMLGGERLDVVGPVDGGVREFLSDLSCSLCVSRVVWVDGKLVTDIEDVVSHEVLVSDLYVDGVLLASDLGVCVLVRVLDRVVRFVSVSGASIISISSS